MRANVFSRANSIFDKACGLFFPMRAYPLQMGGMMEMKPGNVFPHVSCTFKPSSLTTSLSICWITYSQYDAIKQERASSKGQTIFESPLSLISSDFWHPPFFVLLWQLAGWEETERKRERCVVLVTACISLPTTEFGMAFCHRDIAPGTSFPRQCNPQQKKHELPLHSNIQADKLNMQATHSMNK